MTFPKNHEQLMCDAVESLLLTATGRTAIGNVDDVLLRIVRNSEFAAIAGYPSDGLSVDDGDRLAIALWHVIASKDVDEPVGLIGTIPGLSSESSRFDFAECWGSALVNGVPFPEAINGLGSQVALSAQIRIREAFEELLVSIVVLYRVCEACDRFFMFSFLVPKVEAYCKTLGDDCLMSAVCEHLLRTLAMAEDHYA